MYSLELVLKFTTRSCFGDVLLSQLINRHHLVLVPAMNITLKIYHEQDSEVYSFLLLKY